MLILDSTLEIGRDFHIKQITQPYFQVLPRCLGIEINAVRRMLLLFGTVFQVSSHDMIATR